MSNETNKTPVAPTTPVEATPPAPNTEEYNAQMVVKGLMATNQVPEKFVNKETGEVDVEKWAKSYYELEKKFHGQTTEAPEAPVVTEETEPSNFPETLQIKDPEVVEATEEPPSGVTEQEWGRWKGEIMRTSDLSDDTREEIRKRLGVNDTIINDFIEAQRAHLQEGLRKAADVVGGKQKMTEIFTWAANNLDENTRAYINSGLEGPAWEVTLRGLEQQYNMAMANKPKAAEMKHQANVSNPAGVETAKGYGSMYEFTKERSDPRYGKDVRYTNYVNDRASRTEWATIS